MNECPHHGPLNNNLVAQTRYRVARCAHLGTLYVDQIDDERGEVWIDYQRGSLTGDIPHELIESWYSADIEAEKLTADEVWDRLVMRMRLEAA